MNDTHRVHVRQTTQQSNTHVANKLDGAVLLMTDDVVQITVVQVGDDAQLLEIDNVFLGWHHTQQVQNMTAPTLSQQT